MSQLFHRRVLTALSGAALLLCLPARAQEEFTPDDFSLLGYAAGKNCPGGKQGPDQAANPGAGTPQQRTWEAKGAGRPVMVGVKPSQAQIMGALCPGKLNGTELIAADSCPLCEAMNGLDISHRECSDVGSPSGQATVEWQCKEAGKPAGEEDKLQPKHAVQPEDAGVPEKPRIDCEAPDALAGRIDFCTQNRFAKDAAKACREKIEKAWKDAADDLARVLKGNEARNFTRQETELKYSADDYERSRKKLKALVAATREAMDKMARYPTVMVDNLSRGRPWCFSENKEAVQKDLEQIDERLTGGLQAMNESQGLRDRSHGKAELLAEQYGGNTSFQGQRSKNVQSDITGLMQDIEKRRQVAGGQKVDWSDRNRIANPELKLPAFQGGKSYNGSSTITRDDSRKLIADPRTPGLDGRLDPSGVFSTRGSLAASDGSALGFRKGKAPAGADNSVGAALFRDGKDGPVAVGAARETERGLASVETAGVTEGAGKTLAALAELPVRESTVTDPELDLFRRVSAKYRASELFRNARAVKVSGGD